MDEFVGTVAAITYRNDENGYTVLSIKEGRELLTAVGILPFLNTGERVKLIGQWTQHPDYGRQMKVSAYETLPPTTITGIERYLASGLIKGIGPATAKLLVQTFGKDTLSILQYQGQRLTEVEGIGPKRAAQILSSYTEQNAMREAMLFLQTYGISPALAMRIFKAYGERTPELLRDNPYRLVDDVQGVGFKTADAIAVSLGTRKDSSFRMEAGIKFALMEAALSGGHTYLPIEGLIHYAAHLLQVETEQVENTLSSLCIKREIIATTAGEDEPVAYLPRFFTAEGEVARRLVELSTGAQEDVFTDAGDQVARFEQMQGITLDEMQKHAVFQAGRCGVMVITGGPGTGKTTLINCILSLLDNAGQDVLLCAPTGRAAKRMQEATGREAKTLHRLLEYGSGDENVDGFSRDEDNPLEVDTLIVDEMSMVDIFLMRSLLRALKAGTRLLMVGDVDQLPSVGAGNVLRDVIDSGVVEVVRLTEIFRQGEQSMIVLGAHRINRGHIPEMNSKGSDFFMEQQENASNAALTVVDLVLSRLPKFIGVPSTSIQVLCPTKKGEAGVAALNMLLQERINPPSPQKNQRKYGDTLYREGDKVMQIKNNYQMEWTRGYGEEGMGVFNGDMGIITEIVMESRSVTVLFDDDREAIYEDNRLEELDLCYAITVHKSQGSEFPVVVLPILGGPPMLMTRNLLYTAVTRARRLVVLVGRKSAVSSMVSNNHIALRYSALSERLRALAGI